GADGVKLWEQTVGGDSDDFLSVICNTSDGGYVLGGSSYSGAGGSKTSPDFGFLTTGWSGSTPTATCCVIKVLEEPATIFLWTFRAPPTAGLSWPATPVPTPVATNPRRASGDTITG